MTLKLTPQRAAELLKELQYAKVQMGGQLSIRDEYFKQALERVVGGAPKGWRLVPLRPTKEMWTAYDDAPQDMSDEWLAMCLAAPEAPL